MIADRLVREIDRVKVPLHAAPQLRALIPESFHDEL